jgi:arylsulfatase A-like enzyme
MLVKKIVKKNNIHIVSLLLFLGLLLISLSITGCKKKILNHPNVVVIVIDTLRADHLPFYGYPKNTSPFLDSLSAKGTIFERVFSTSSITAPATASLFTSLYPFQHGVTMNMLGVLKFREKNPNIKIKLNRIPGEIETLGEVFKQAGYACYGVSDNQNICDKEGFTQGFDKFKTYSYDTAQVVNHRLKEWKDDITRNKKYFLYIHYMDPHGPYKRRAPWYQEKSNPRSDTVSRYDSEINYVDQKIQEMFQLFNWQENTLVIVTADHGEEFWDHGEIGHGYSLYKEVVHVPLVFFYPEGGIKPQRVLGNFSLLDILPTLRDILDLPDGEFDQGISLLPFLRGDSSTPSNRYIFSHLLDKKSKKNNTEAISVLSDNWHFIRSLQGEEYLFDLKFDFNEKFNKIEKGLPIAKKFLSQYLFFRKNCKKYKQDVVDHTLNKKDLEKLKSLGYVQ